PAVEAELGIDVQRLLQAQYAPGVAEREVQAQRREVGDRVVHPRKPRDREQLRPPARARGTGELATPNADRCNRSARFDREPPGQATDLSFRPRAPTRGGRPRRQPILARELDEPRAPPQSSRPSAQALPALAGAAQAARGASFP